MTTREERRRAFAKKLAQLRATYVAQLPDRIAEMRVAASTADHAEVARIAHALRGSGGSYGIRRMVQLTLDLEKACSEEDTVRVDAFVTELEALTRELTEE